MPTHHGAKCIRLPYRETIPAVNDFETRCLVIVTNVATTEGWPLSADDLGALVRAIGRHVSENANRAEIEVVVRNYYQDGPLFEMMSRRGYQEGEDYWESYRQGFARLAARRGVDYADCEDVANEAIAQALRAFSQYAFRGPLNAWLYRIAINVCNDWHKRRLRRAAVEAPLSTTEDPEKDVINSPLAPSSERPEEVLLHDERRLILQTTLERLLSDRDLLILHYTFIETEYIDDRTGQPRPWTDADIARLVGLAPASIPTIRGRVLRRLGEDPHLKEIMAQLLGPKWFIDRARPVRKRR